jgi:hypothetical protein
MWHDRAVALIMQSSYFQGQKAHDLPATFCMAGTKKKTCLLMGYHEQLIATTILHGQAKLKKKYWIRMIYELWGHKTQY